MTQEAVRRVPTTAEIEALISNLRNSEIDSIWYATLTGFIGAYPSEKIAIVTVLLEKMKAGYDLPPEEAVTVLAAVMDDLAEAGVFGDEEDEEGLSFDEESLTFFDEGHPGGDLEEMVEFEIKTVKDEDPKNRLN